MNIEADVVTQARDFRLAIGEWAKTYGPHSSHSRSGGAPALDTTVSLRLWSASYVRANDNDNDRSAAR